LIQKSSAARVTNGEVSEPVEVGEKMEASSLELEQRAAALFLFSCGSRAASMLALWRRLSVTELPPPVSNDPGSFL
jgi:hypothetical protein